MSSLLSLLTFYDWVMGIDPFQTKLFYGPFVFFMMGHQSCWTHAWKGGGAPRLILIAQAHMQYVLAYEVKNVHFNFIFPLIKPLLKSSCKFENNGCSLLTSSARIDLLLGLKVCVVGSETHCRELELSKAELLSCLMSTSALSVRR